MKTFKESFVSSFGAMLGLAAGLAAGAALLEKFGPKKKEDDKADTKDAGIEDDWVK